MAGWVLAIDFGTSFTSAAVASHTGIRLVELDGGWRVPSAVYLEADGTVVVGREAERRGMRAPERLEATPKRYLGERAPLLLGGTPIAVEDAVAAVLSAVHTEARRLMGGGTPDRVRLTHPAAWQRERLAALTSAAERAGIAPVALMAEPVAAATHFARGGAADARPVAVYDLGGGTFDTAVLRRDGEGFALAGRPGGIDRLGGELFDQHLYRHVGAVLEHDDPDAWFALRGSSDPVWRSANAALVEEVRRAKEALSRDQAATVWLPAPLDREVRVSRGELEELIRDDVVMTVDELQRTVEEAGLAPDDLAGVYLAGGSSRIPLVARLVADRFGRQPQVLDEPKAVIVLGAAASGTPSATAPPAPRAAEPVPPPPAPADPGHQPAPPAEPPAPRYTLAGVREAAALIGADAAARPAVLVLAGCAALVALFGMLSVFLPITGTAGDSSAALSLWDLATQPGVSIAGVVAALAVPLAALLACGAWLGDWRPGRTPTHRGYLPLVVAGTGGALVGVAAVPLATWLDISLGAAMPVLVGASVLTALCGVCGVLVHNAVRIGAAPRGSALVTGMSAVGGLALVAGSLMRWHPGAPEGGSAVSGLTSGVGVVTLICGLLVLCAAGVTAPGVTGWRAAVPGARALGSVAAGAGLGAAAGAIAFTERLTPYADAMTAAEDARGVSAGLVVALAGGVLAMLAAALPGRGSS